MPLISSDGKIFLTFGSPEESPELVVTQANQLELKKADLKLEVDRKVLFGGNGQISAVGDLSFLTGATSPTEQLRIFANGNIGIGTGATVPTNKLEVAGKIKANDLEITGTITANTMTGPLAIQNNLTVSGNLQLGDLAVNKFSSDGTLNGNSDQAIPTEKAVKTYVDNIAVTTQKIANDAVTTAKIADNSVTTAKIQDGAITQEKLAASISLPIPDGSVGKAQLANDAITTDKIANNSITTAKIQNGAITQEKLAASISLKIPDGSVGTTQLASNAVTNDKIANNSITPNKLNFPISPGSSQWQGVDGGPIYYDKGNVGIGTSNPQAQLHLSTSRTTLRLQSTQPTQNGNRGGIAKIEFWSDPQGAKTEWQQAVIESSDSDDMSKAYGGVISFYVNRSSKDTNGKTVDPKRVVFMTENKVDIPVSLYVKGVDVKSSREIKENIIDFSSQEAMETLAGLNAVKFNYCDDKEKELTVGFIAEDVPDLLASHDRKGVRSLEIIAVLTKIVQQQQEELSNLKKRLNALEARA
ncbi:MAG: tail fiber domain-containing protein [Nostoc desertorum CM1-VF14]|jgi:hypothetical protein|nr:tail fiber domain-containing protein [Nostoc desertorum CM1-VF14]